MVEQMIHEGFQSCAGSREARGGLRIATSVWS